MSADHWECPHGYGLDTCTDCDEENAKKLASLRQGVETLRKAADKLAWCHGHSHPGDECEWLKQMRAALRETEGLVVAAHEKETK